MFPLNYKFLRLSYFKKIGGTRWTDRWTGAIAIYTLIACNWNDPWKLHDTYPSPYWIAVLYEVFSPVDLGIWWIRL